MDDFQRNIIKYFWQWVSKHQEHETIVEYDGNGELSIWVDFNDLEEFTDRYIADVENRLEATLFNGHVYIKLTQILGGHGFNMDNVWNLKPSDLNGNRY